MSVSRSGTQGQLRGLGGGGGLRGFAGCRVEVEWRDRGVLSGTGG